MAFVVFVKDECDGSVVASGFATGLEDLLQQRQLVPKETSSEATDGRLGFVKCTFTFLPLSTVVCPVFAVCLLRICETTDERS